MQLIIVFLGLGSGGSHNMVRCEGVKGWSTSEQFLIVEKADKLRYYPLKNIESFYEEPVCD